MPTPVYIKSLYPNTSTYCFKDGGWELMDSEKFPTYAWLSNQTGLQVGVVAPVNVILHKELPQLLSKLPFIHDDLVREAVIDLGLKHDTSITGVRWRKLAAPRPIGEVEDGTVYAYAQWKQQFYKLKVTDNGKGGWSKCDRVDTEACVKFPVWGYNMFVPVQDQAVRLIPCILKRIVTSTLDQLYCYDITDVVTKSYFCYAQPKIKKIWEASNETHN